MAAGAMELICQLLEEDFGLKYEPIDSKNTKSLVANLTQLKLKKLLLKT